MNIKQAFLAMDACFAANITPHFIGLHGIGKSAMIYQYAALRDYDVVEIRVGLMADAGDLVGIQEFIKCQNTGEPLSTRHVLPDWFMKAVAQLTTAGEKGRRVIIFIDELNRGHKDLLQAIFELVYDRSLKGVKMAEGCQVVAASNPPTGNYSVLDFDDSAFQDRFVHIKLEPTQEEFVAWGREQNKSGTTNVEGVVLDFVTEIKGMLENNDLEDFNLDFIKPSRRSWDRVSKIMRANPNPEIELELIMGIVGMKAAIAFKEFRGTYFKSLKPELVLNEYKKVKNDILAAISKDRTDMLGNLNTELEQLLKGMTSLTTTQADNLAELVHDLPIEHAYALGVIVKTQSKCTMNVEGLTDKQVVAGSDKKLGMFAHKKFVERILHVHGKREELMKNSPVESKTTTEAPF